MNMMSGKIMFLCYWRRHWPKFVVPGNVVCVLLNVKQTLINCGTPCTYPCFIINSRIIRARSLDNSYFLLLEGSGILLRHMSRILS